MEEQIEQDVDLNNDTDLESEEVETKQEETKVEKPQETPEARYARLQRQQEQLLKKYPELAKEKETKSEEKATPSNDLGEKAYLIANGYKEPREQELAKKLAKETGKDIESLLATTYFQTELKALRESMAEEAATPKGGKRSNNSSVDSVEYWLAKGELPPASEVELRRQVVNARIKKEESKGIFYNS